MDFYAFAKKGRVIASPVTEQDIRSALKQGEHHGRIQAFDDFEALRMCDKIVDVESLYQEGLKQAETEITTVNWWNKSVYSAVYAVAYRDAYLFQYSFQFDADTAIACFEYAYEDLQNNMQADAEPALESEEDQQG